MDNAGACLGELYEECVRASGIHPSCDKFFQILLPNLRRIASRVAHQFGAREETDDLVQEINLKLMSKDPSILAGLPKEPSAALAYFSVVAANAARDYFRYRGAAKRGLDRTISLESVLASITGGISSYPDHDRLIAQIEGCLPSDPKSRTIFSLYYRQGFSAREIAAIPAVELSVKGVESVIHRAISHIRQQLAPREGKMAPGRGNSAPNSS